MNATNAKTTAAANKGPNLGREWSTPANGLSSESVSENGNLRADDMRGPAASTAWRTRKRELRDAVLAREVARQVEDHEVQRPRAYDRVQRGPPPESVRHVRAVADEGHANHERNHQSSGRLP